MNNFENGRAKATECVNKKIESAGLKINNAPLTYAIARAAGQDEGNRNMRKNGRTQWNEEDYSVASKKTNELIDLLERQKFGNAIPSGLFGWVEDYKKARHAGNISLAKQIKTNIDAKIKELGLNKHDVYFAAGDPDDPKYRNSDIKNGKLWEAIKERDELSKNPEANKKRLKELQDYIHKEYAKPSHQAPNGSDWDKWAKG
jgi:hypothetical protein